MRLTADLDATTVEVDDPVVGDAGLGVEARLLAAVHVEADIGHLDVELDVVGLEWVTL